MLKYGEPVVRPDDGFKYYAYILLYVDDCLFIHHDVKSALYEIDKYFLIKKRSIWDPDIYLGLKLRLVSLCNGVREWSANPASTYRNQRLTWTYTLKSKDRESSYHNGLWHHG